MTHFQRLPSETHAATLLACKLHVGAMASMHTSACRIEGRWAWPEAVGGGTYRTRADHKHNTKYDGNRTSEQTNKRALLALRFDLSLPAPPANQRPIHPPETVSTVRRVW
jgi:hypothetical protein